MVAPARASSSLYSLSLAHAGTDMPVTRTLGLSLSLHLAVLLVALIVSWTTGSERPLGSSVQVSLVTLPPAPKAVEAKSQHRSPPQKPAQTPQEVPVPPPQAKVEPRKPVTLPVPHVKAQAAPEPVVTPPVPQVRTPEVPLPPLPPPVAKSKAFAPLPPPPEQVARAPKRGPENPFRGALKDVDLPREVPKFGDLSPDRTVSLPPAPIIQAKPQRAPDRTLRDINSLISRLKVPDHQRTVVPPPPVPDEPKRTSRDTSLEEDYRKELEKELERVHRAAPAPAAPAEFKTASVKTADARPVPPPVQDAQPTPATKPTQVRPETTMKVPGMGPGSNSYLARVQQRISSFWQAPPVDVTADSLLVVVRFRLTRNGTVSSVVVERSSGNDYYDLAAKRAVLNADPLPPFPKDLTDPYYDAHFSFVLGGQTG